MKRIALLFSACTVLSLCFFACGRVFSPEGRITVITREAGSGTRTAFTEMFGLNIKDNEGMLHDTTSAYADVNDSTGIVLANVSTNQLAVGYISVASLNDEVRALSIDGVFPSVDSIESETYPASRPFVIAHKGKISLAAADFMSFVMSEQGRIISRENGFIPTGDITTHTPLVGEGKVTVAGSSSVSPLIEKLSEEYRKVCPDVTVEIQQSDSTSGIKTVSQGICDLGLSSRQLKESELAEGIIPTVFALDGIAVIVNPQNMIKNLSSDDVRRIFSGEAVFWKEVIE